MQTNKKVYIITVVSTVIIGVTLALALFNPLSILGPYSVMGIIGVGIGLIGCSFIKSDLKLQVITCASTLIIAIGCIYVINCVRFGISEPRPFVINKNTFYRTGYSSVLYNLSGQRVIGANGDEYLYFGYFNHEDVFVKFYKQRNYDEMSQAFRYSIFDMKGDKLKDSIWHTPKAEEWKEQLKKGINPELRYEFRVNSDIYLKEKL